jgi:hypothetical protein
MLISTLKGTYDSMAAGQSNTDFGSCEFLMNCDWTVFVLEESSDSMRQQWRRMIEWLEAQREYPIRKVVMIFDTDVDKDGGFYMNPASARGPDTRTVSWMGVNAL